ncbi:MAG: hypothetical protein JSV88_26795 [Candidatus Aminicenantes bacterium]|nr:MAG: hypothetical protein JSV88_26795 [Candidatus Aminicenantes bacterium]
MERTGVTERNRTFTYRTVLQKPWIILALFFLSWFGILILTGTLFSGYHFMDDHGILKESKDVANSNLQKEVKIFQKNLLAPSMRFRPFYWVHRRLMLAVLGTNFLALSIYIGCLAVLTSFFLYLFMRKIGFSLVESILFTSLTLLGEQAAIWWRLGNNETLGMLMLSIALWLMALSTSAPQGRRKILYEILFVLFVILASWSKESFILMIPALMFAKVWLTYRQKHGTLFNQKFLQGPGTVFSKRVPGRRRQKIASLKENLISGIILLLVCLIELVHVVKNVGTSGVGYAGYEGFRLSAFIKTGIQGFMAVHGWVILVQLMIIGILVYLNSKENRTGLMPVSSLVWPVILPVLLVFPQIVLHMKSGMTERYLLPGVMGYTFLMVLLLRYTREKSGKKKVLSIIMVALLAVISLQQLRVTRYTAIGFAFDGQQINAWLRSIEQNTREQDMILVITHLHQHYEASISLKTYLDMKSHRKNTLFSPTDLRVKSAKASFWKDLNRFFFSHYKDFSLENMEFRNRFQAILLFPGLEEKFLKASANWFDPAHFKRYTSAAGYVSYYRKATKDTEKKRGSEEARKIGKEM